MSNVFSFTGTIARDAEVRSTPSGQSLLNVSVANNIGFGDRQKTLWIRVTLWGKRAEGSFVNYLKKGQSVFVSGELSQQEYRGNDGNMKTSLELNANVLDLVGKRSDNQYDAPPAQASQAAQYPASNTNQQPEPPLATPPADYGQSNGDYDDDIPF